MRPNSPLVRWLGHEATHAFFYLVDGMIAHATELYGVPRLEAIARLRCFLHIQWEELCLRGWYSQDLVVIRARYADPSYWHGLLNEADERFERTSATDAMMERERALGESPVDLHHGPFYPLIRRTLLMLREIADNPQQSRISLWFAVQRRAFGQSPTRQRGGKKKVLVSLFIFSFIYIYFFFFFFFFFF